MSEVGFTELISLPDLDQLAQRDLSINVFVGNDCVNFIDQLGLWIIDRDGGATASAIAEEGDTIKDLAARIGLSPSEYKAWLTIPNGTAQPTSVDEDVSCSEFEIPNTVLAYWAGDGVLGVGKPWVSWNPNIKYLEKLGFNVTTMEYPGQPGGNGQAQSILEALAKSKEMHGFYFWGHGNTPYPSSGIGARKGPDVVTYSTINLSYKMGLGLVFACDSNSGKGVLYSGAPGGIWNGYSGTLNPITDGPFRLKHFIKPGDQGTKVFKLK